ncbi:unnamed protein product [Clonostachys solani]|uniref:Diadenosine 5',5'''-P1,P4-tetraphosphate phosphorylase 2 n=1 Tax=Clonostachys solani TaxID=160281 RepID=A0A9N9ZBS6_9HYPO|nr:unnamed protein product [Clonostachys solani]
MTRIKAPAELPELVRAAFSKARSSGDLHFFPTQVALLNVDSIPFQLRFSPALANKPKGPTRDPTTPQKPFDPFENPPAALKVADLGPAHFLVLNKFAVVPEHFILATTPFKHQTHVLEPDDLESTLACIEAYDAVAGEEATSGGGQSEQGLYAFFNCGDHSGASQPHRHIQLLPIARMRDGLDGQSSAWDVMVDRLDALKPPFSVFSEAIRLGMSGEELHQTYLRLYRRACRAVAVHTGDGAAATSQDAPSQGETLISYNMAMTKNTMAIAPRLAEGARIVGPDGQDLGSVALNGTVLAGTALVKNEVEWEALVKDAKGLHVVLKAIGIPQEGSWKS